MSRDYKLVQKAIARGELSLPEGWHVDDAAVQAWLQGRRQEIDGERERTKQYADRSGWPACLGPRRVQILNLLAHIGVPVSVKDMAATLKIRASSVHKQLVRLLREGWVIGLGLSRASFFTLGPIALTLQQERATCELFKHDTQ